MNVTADIYWAQVPEWLILSASPRGLQVYAILCRAADKNTRDTILLRSTIAKRARCSRKTVDRAIEELSDMGAVTVTHRIDEHGDSAANNYRVHFMQQGVATQVSLPIDIDDHTGGDISDGTGRDIDVAHNQSQSKPESLKPEEEASQLATSERNRDVLFEVVTALHVDGPLSKTERGKLNKACALLREVDVTPDEYPLLRQALASKYRNGVAITAMTVATRVGEARHYLKNGDMPAPSPDELAERVLWREAQAEYDAAIGTKGALP